MAEPVSNPMAPASGGSADGNAVHGALPWRALWAGLAAVGVAGVLATQFLAPHGAGGGLLPIMTILVCLLAAVFDAATGHIPNPVTYTAILLGLGLNLAASLIVRLGGADLSHWMGSVGAEQALLGFAACAGIGLVSLLLAGMGGGDVKLLVAVGALLGFSQSMDVLLWTLLIAVPYAILNLIIRGRLNGVLAVVGLGILKIVYCHRFEQVAAPSRSTIPLAVPLALAMFCARMLPREVLMRWINGV